MTKKVTTTTASPYYPRSGWSQRISETGNRYGRLEVVAYHSTEDMGTHRDVYWIVRCDCGRHEIVERRYLRGTAAPKTEEHQYSTCRHLNKGRTKSPVFTHWERLMKTDDLEESLKDFELFRIYFEPKYMDVKLTEHGMVDRNVYLRKHDETKRHSMTNSCFSYERPGITRRSHTLSRELIEQYHLAGLTDREIAEELGANFETIHRILQNELGLKSRTSKKKATDEERRAATRKRQNARYKAQRDKKIAEGTYRAPGRPRKYATPEEAKAAQRRKSREWYQRKVTAVARRDG